jgi:hypothetical protein
MLQTLKGLNNAIKKLLKRGFFRFMSFYSVEFTVLHQIEIEVCARGTALKDGTAFKKV